MGAGGGWCGCGWDGCTRYSSRYTRGYQLRELLTNVFAMDGAAAGSGGPSKSPYTHGRHDDDKGQLGVSIQFDLFPKASGGSLDSLINQRVAGYYDTGVSLSDNRNSRGNEMPDAVEMLRRRYARSGAGPSSGPASTDKRRCFMCALDSPVPSGAWLFWPPKQSDNAGQPPHHRVCRACQQSLRGGCPVKAQRVSTCGAEGRGTPAPTMMRAALTAAKVRSLKLLS
jgi:hypothetical protein